ncbi:unnamed protein product [Pleuronectes platessa]|uniref:Uncharacterized protein n=1 Tax=Pleuronectes platessa TaxID=8262 RepID=A0A9N7V9Z1_PLEPL|nr:unnamed protein product [Pleuronectes platessa]
MASTRSEGEEPGVSRTKRRVTKPPLRTNTHAPAATLIAVHPAASGAAIIIRAQTVMGGYGIPLLERAPYSPNTCSPGGRGGGLVAESWTMDRKSDVPLSKAPCSPNTCSPSGRGGGLVAESWTMDRKSDGGLWFDSTE